MTKGKFEVRSWRLAVSMFLATTAPAGLAFAADPTPPPEAPPAAAAPPTAAVPTMPPPPAAAPAAPAAVLPAASEAPKPDLKKIDMGFALRVGSAVQGAGAANRNKLNDIGLDEFTLEARFSGSL